MKGRRHRQRQRTLGTVGLEDFTGLLDGRLGAGDHGLGRIVEVHGFDHFVRIRTEGLHHLGAACDHLGRLHPEDGGHGTGAHRHGLLHGLGAKAHQWHSLRQRQHTGGHHGRILAQGMASHSGRRNAGLAHPDTVGSNAGHQHHGLGIGGERQDLLGAVLDQLPQVFTQGIGGFLQRFAHFWMVAPGVEHADRLRPLARKDKGKRFHLVAWCCVLE